MIQLIQGPPRSGKSYFAVNYLMKFASFDELYQEFILQPEVLIISNIEGLKIRHWRLDDCLKGRTLEEFFSIENFEQIQAKTKKMHIILLIDEAHEIFPNGFRSEKIYNFFAYHGHIGLDVILMTQGIESMSRLFNPLLEYIVCVTQRSKSVVGAFSYTYRDLKGRYLFSKVLRKDQKVFRAYKSFRKDEHNKPQNALFKWAVAIVGFFLVGGLLFKGAMGELKSKSVAAVPQKQGIESRAVKTAPAAQLVSAAAAPGQEVLPIQDDVFWRRYPVEGYLHSPGGDVYVIYGKRIGGDRTRNFDENSMSVEYYGLPLNRPVDVVDDLPAETGRAVSARPSAAGGAEQIAPQAHALASATAP